MKEKAKDIFVQIGACLAVGALGIGIFLFTISAFNNVGETEPDKKEVVSDKSEVPPVEVKKSAVVESEEKKEEGVTETPASVNEQESQGTDNSNVNVSLQEQIQSMISTQYTAGGGIAVSAGRIADGSLVLVNNQSMQAASLIKLFVAGCVYETMGDTSQYESQLSSMISVSDNSACNSLVSALGGGDAQIGMEKVNQYCMNHGFTETHMGRLMLQPNDMDDNYTSVRDCGNFLMNIYNGSLAGSSQILSYMKQQERTGKIPVGVPAGVETANKTGELDFVENDVAIVFHPSGPYVLCVMSENLSDSYSSRVFINSLSANVYNLMG